jgi:hypothetical protein
MEQEARPAFGLCVPALSREMREGHPANDGSRREVRAQRATPDLIDVRASERLPELFRQIVAVKWTLIMIVPRCISVSNRTSGLLRRSSHSRISPELLAKSVQQHVHGRPA